MISLRLKICDQPHEAPNYTLEENVKGCEFTDAVIVKNGTVNGKPTVDIVLVDKDGNKFVAMTSGEIIKMLAKALDD